MPEKEIWKLLELLNEYEWVNNWRYSQRTEMVWNELVTNRRFICDYIYEENQDMLQTYICSLKFGFIKRLVEQDKIDLDEIPYLTDEHWWGFDEYEELIMILSIQENPIDFLCSILK